MVDALAVHVFENEEGLAQRRHSGVDQVRDVGMTQPREDASLALEPRLAVATDQAGVQQLDGRFPFEATVAAIGKPDLTHAAIAQRRPQGVRTDRQTCEGRLRRQRDRLVQFKL